MMFQVPSQITVRLTIFCLVPLNEEGSGAGSVFRGEYPRPH